MENALIAALDTAAPTATAAIAAEDFHRRHVRARLAPRADRRVLRRGDQINDPDPATRAFRLGLLARFRDAVHAVADFSKIEG